MPHGVQVFLERVSVYCFAASYAVALLLEVIHLLRPGSAIRFVSICFGSAGLLPHTIYLAVQRPAARLAATARCSS